MGFKDMLHKQVRDLFSVGIIVARDKVCHLGQSIDNDPYGRVARLCLWQVCNTICSDMLPCFIRQRQRYQLSSRLTLTSFVSLADLTAMHILMNLILHARPPVQLLDILHSSGSTNMTSIGRVMQVFEYPDLDGPDIRYNNCTFLVVHTILVHKL